MKLFKKLNQKSDTVNSNIFRKIANYTVFNKNSSYALRTFWSLIFFTIVSTLISLVYEYSPDPTVLQNKKAYFPSFSRWDSVQFDSINTCSWKREKIYQYAFPPLWPCILSKLKLYSKHYMLIASLLNLVLYTISLYMLEKTYFKSEKTRAIFFALPYSEAVYFFLLCLLLRIISKYASSRPLATTFIVSGLTFLASSTRFLGILIAPFLVLEFYLSINRVDFIGLFSEINSDDDLPKESSNTLDTIDNITQVQLSENSIPLITSCSSVDLDELSVKNTSIYNIVSNKKFVHCCGSTSKLTNLSLYHRDNDSKQLMVNSPFGNTQTKLSRATESNLYILAKCTYTQILNLSIKFVRDYRCFTEVTSSDCFDNKKSLKILLNHSDLKSNNKSISKFNGILESENYLKKDNFEEYSVKSEEKHNDKNTIKNSKNNRISNKNVTILEKILLLLKNIKQFFHNSPEKPINKKYKFNHFKVILSSVIMIIKFFRKFFGLYIIIFTMLVGLSSVLPSVIVQHLGSKDVLNRHQELCGVKLCESELIKESEFSTICNNYLKRSLIHDIDQHLLKQLSININDPNWLMQNSIPPQDPLAQCILSYLFIKNPSISIYTFVQKHVWGLQLGGSFRHMSTWGNLIFALPGLYIFYLGMSISFKNIEIYFISTLKKNFDKSTLNSEVILISHTLVIALITLMYGHAQTLSRMIASSPGLYFILRRLPLRIQSYLSWVTLIWSIGHAIQLPFV